MNDNAQAALESLAGDRYRCYCKHLRWEHDWNDDGIGAMICRGGSIEDPCVCTIYDPKCRQCRHDATDHVRNEPDTDDGCMWCNCDRTSQQARGR